MNPFPNPEAYRLSQDSDAPREWDSINGAHDSPGFDPNQPRVPAGNPDGGQWTGAGGGQRPIAEPVLLAPAIALAPRILFAAQKSIETALILFTWLSAQNRSDKQAILAFKAREYRPDGRGELDLDEVKLVDRDEVDAVCPRLDEVQERTERAVGFIRRTRWDLRPAEFGTAVHTNLKEQIQSLADPNFRAEVSYLKNREENYGRKDSIRIDVLERVGDGTVCVYDIKTGQRGLSIARMNEMAKNVFKAYSDTQRIIVSEVRPRR